MREFNVTGICIPSEHYMVDISDKLNQIAAMVEKGRYFTMNRARQYGKTTTLGLLEKELVKQGYSIANISFEGLDDESFENAESFCLTLQRQISYALENQNANYAKKWKNKPAKSFEELDIKLNALCQEKKTVLIVDETDKTSNNLVFLRFIGMLRDKYLQRDKPNRATFRSVILAGVYDIKNLCLNPDLQDLRIDRIVKNDVKKSGKSENRGYRGSDKINSPWNIAADFEIDMSFSAQEIATMLNEYEKDHKTGMDIETVSKEIRAYTNGYPYLVSRLCQKIDEDLNKNWTLKGLQEAIKLILVEQSTLFDDLIKNIENYDELNDLLKRNILNGERILFNVDNYAIKTGLMFGIFLQKGEHVSIHNEIFELRLYNYYISQKGSWDKERIPVTLPSYVVENSKLNMALAIEKFMNHYYELYHKSNENFLEKECRLLFLTFLKPIINGNGFYHVEAETRDMERTDIIVDFNNEQFIVELKLWRGEASHENALEQIVGYLDSKNKDTGYLLTFDFRKRDNIGKPKAEWIEHKGKRIFDCMVGV